LRRRRTNRQRGWPDRPITRFLVVRGPRRGRGGARSPTVREKVGPCNRSGLLPQRGCLDRGARNRADPPADVRARLIDADLSPRPFYPDRLPRLLRESDASIDVSRRRFPVTYDRGEAASGRPTGYVSFGRTRRRQLTDDFKLWRLRGYEPKRVLVGRVRAWYVCGHVCGYDFRAQRFTYQAFGVYYARPGASERTFAQSSVGSSGCPRPSPESASVRASSAMSCEAGPWWRVERVGPLPRAARRPASERLRQPPDAALPPAGRLSQKRGGYRVGCSICA
jgi:hypothetical protein